jgi:Fe2+ or Zn2+ uptake regulation protein
MKSPAPDPVRLPKNYQLILDVVHDSGRGRHLTMSDVFAQTSARRPGIGYSTVYRGLVRLRELGLISEIVVPGAVSATYEPAADRHAHFFCVGCSAIEDVEYALPTRVLRNVAEKSGFDIAAGTVTFEGLCGDCRVAAHTA